VRLHDLANRLTSPPAEHALMRAQLILAHIRIVQALDNLQDAERSFALAQRAADLITPLDTAA
jgi:hypothetical protein